MPLAKKTVLTYKKQDPAKTREFSEWIGEGSFDRDKEKEIIQWKDFFVQRGWSTMAEEPHTKFRCAKQAWVNALQAIGDDQTKQHHSESPISVDINAFGVGIKKLQKTIWDGVKLLRAKVMDMRAVALPKDDQRRVAYLSRRKGVFARQLLPRCPDSRVPFKPSNFRWRVSALSVFL